MMLSKNGTGPTNGPADSMMEGLVDIGPLLASLDTSTRRAAENVLARALIYAEDADEALKRAHSIRTEAERFRAEVESATVQATERLCAELRAEAQQELEDARQAREEAEAHRAEAEEERRTAEAVRREAEEFRRAMESDARDQAKAVLTEAREQAAREANEMRDHAAEEVRKALAGIQKMKEAAQEELQAQKVYTEALRIKAMAPSREDLNELMAAPESAVAASRSRGRSRQRAAA